ncbi:hypothetical protein BDN70DRAFT_900592 [Pholiota conissans]|uniref:Uncharacterized protein n=1 Tax=Pholiota conissans TaxID=109636 RepID=A0A9P6CMK3_9AGAR|nr:hypothetical protein BDN70DRAFT_900592 [Pholiota conissans]
MAYICSGCNSEYQSERGLEWHQGRCEDFLSNDIAIYTIPNALQKFEEKRARKRRKLEEAKKPQELETEILYAQPQNVVEEAEIPLMQLAESTELPLPEPLAEQVPEIGPNGRVVQKKRLTWKLLQQLPAAPTPIPEPAPPADPMHPALVPPSAILQSSWKPALTTVPNSFGLYREYNTIPTHNPDDTTCLQDLVDNVSENYSKPCPQTSNHLISLGGATAGSSSFFPFQNSTTFGLMDWLWTGSAMKSISEMKKLVDFLKSDAFKPEDLQNFDIRAETAKLDQYLDGPPASSSCEVGPQPSCYPKDHWRESGVQIQVPDGQPHPLGSDIPTFTVPGLFHRSIVEVIKSTFSDSASHSFHYTPFKSFWHSDSGNAESRPQTQRLYDELYSSNAMIDAHTKLQQQPPEPGCSLEKVVAGMMLWSDSTHLANFGTASLWPIYLYFGNQSKFVRGKPNAAACHHIAYIPKLPPNFLDFYLELTGNGPSEDVLTHCRRELMHAVWALLLDEEFMHAYKHGIVIECPDDYPEKVLLATIRNFGSCPCPRCLVPKTKIPDIGKVYDNLQRQQTHRTDNSSQRFDITRAREYIFTDGKGVKSTYVEGILEPKSLVPTKNAFSQLSKFGFNFYDMLVPDFMHEFELGVWKSFFIHLVRIMVAEGTVQELNQRYRQVPTFGRSTIRKFTENASAMKKMAARNYEDLLQCALPVFDGLFVTSEHDKDISSLLFTLAEWHCLAKLRMHTETTIGLLEQCTTSLGTQLRRFERHICPCFDTRELPREEAARHRRQARKAAANGNPSEETASATKTPPKRKAFNLFTIKLHALGDYVKTIKTFGTTDSYSTQPGELEHRRVKRFYARTNKNGAVRQMTRLERRENILVRSKRRHEKSKSCKNKANSYHALGFADSEALPYTPPEFHHHVSTSRNFPVHIETFLASTSKTDPAIKNFIPKLQEHLLGRTLHPTWSGDGNEFTDDERGKIFIVNMRMFHHKVMRINYTGYDVRLGQDSINSRNHADIMILSRNNDGHPFEYGRVISVFHVEVIHNVEGAGPSIPVSKEVLWVHWFKRDASYRAGFKQKRLHRLEFLPSNNPAAFGFLDPDEVIRAVHLIPSFRYGTTKSLLRGESLARAPGEIDDWRFVDRDMYMRYAGGGVGHYKVDLNDVPILNSEPRLDEAADPPADPTVVGEELDEEERGDEEFENREEEERPESDKEEFPEEQQAGLKDGKLNGMDDMGAEDGEGNYLDPEDDEGGPLIRKMYK